MEEGKSNIRSEIHILIFDGRRTPVEKCEQVIIERRSQVASVRENQHNPSSSEISGYVLKKEQQHHFISSLENSERQRKVTTAHPSFSRNKISIIMKF